MKTPVIDIAACKRLGFSSRSSVFFVPFVFQDLHFDFHAT
jgi:hypothetical protein